jgi:hypothetical protein
MFTPRPPLSLIRPVAVAVLTFVIAGACASGAGRSAAEAGGAPAAPIDAADSAALVTRLGVDTVAVERVVYAPRRVEADVLLRVPATTRTRYVLELSPAGEFAGMEAVTQQAVAGRGPPTRHRRVTRVGDSLRVESHAEGQLRARTVAAPNRLSLPFIDFVHWPFELALTRARRAGQARTAQPVLIGGRVQDFAVADLGPDSMTITDPLLGTMRVRVDAGGRLLALDAGATTQKLLVERRRWMNDDAMRALAVRWAEQDAVGRSLGALSGRAQMAETIAGARIGADYGTPSKRGREIWGVLVPFGQVWRTGANRATHFTTDRDLIFGSGTDTLLVPAGRYTLFSIPERDGGLLIINRQTDQAGTAYDPARDHGRVRLTPRPLADPVEVFTIVANPEGAGGVLRLQWDRTELIAPFRVRSP